MKKYDRPYHCINRNVIKKRDAVSFHVVAGPECQKSVYESCETQSLLLSFRAQ